MLSTRSLLCLGFGFLLSCEVHSVSEKESPPVQEKPIAPPAPIYIAPKDPEPPKPVAPSANLSPYVGPETAKVTVVAFTDYQCPFCNKAEGTLKDLQSIYGQDLRIVWKDLPLVMHKSAKAASIAARAAGRQGSDKFLAMHTILFANQKTLPLDASLYESFASGVAGLDVERWKKDVVDPETLKLVDIDLSLAASLGVSATPTFFINGEHLSGAQPITKFQEVAERQKMRAEGILASGVAPEKLYEALVSGGLPTKPAGVKTPTTGIVYKVPVESTSPTPASTPAITPSTQIATPPKDVFDIKF